MSVKIVRLKNGEDIIADIHQVHDNETNQPVALRFGTPYSVAISSDEYKKDLGKEIKLSNPKIEFFPWLPLSKDKEVFLDPSEILCYYEPHKQVLDQYAKLLKIISHEGGDEDGRGDVIEFGDEDILTQGEV